jgi:hypothetical protein
LHRVLLYDKCEISDTMSNTAEGLPEETEDDISQVTYCFDLVGMYRIFILSNFRLSCLSFFPLHYRSFPLLIYAPAHIYPLKFEPVAWHVFN